MRKFLILAVMAVSFEASAFSLRLEPESEVYVDEAFTVEVRIDDVSADAPLLSFAFDVTGTAEFGGATVGDGFFDDSGLLSATDVAGSTFSSLFGSDILLATLTLTARSAGDQRIGVSGLTSAGEGLFFSDLGSVSNLTGDTTVTALRRATVIPLPPAWVLFLGGVLALRGFGRLAASRHGAVR